MNKKTETGNKHRLYIYIVLIVCLLISGCGKRAESTAGEPAENEENVKSETLENIMSDQDLEKPEPETQAPLLEDGVYTVDFDTDGSMFHVNEACEGKGTLTVRNGEMVLHISLPSKNVVNLFPGLVIDAQKDGAVLLEPTIDTVTYSDGMTEEVHGFDIPITVIGEEFDLALLGTKGKWYDHRVVVSDPVKKDDGGQANTGNSLMQEDGEYTVNVTLEGGSGRATITSPAVVSVKEGKYYVRIEWSSPNYDYMKTGGETYLPVNTEGNSVFELPMDGLEERLSVIADTTAMGNPHEIEYVIVFDPDSMKKEQ